MNSDLYTEEYAQRVSAVHGEVGEQWLDNLPDLLKLCAERWDLTLSSRFTRLSYNYVVPATFPDGKSVVLKLGIPTQEFQSEIAALTAYQGHGCVNLLKADAKCGVMLLEQLVPGQMLVTVEDDQQATTIAAEVMQKLWHEDNATDVFPSVAKWLTGFDRLTEYCQQQSAPFSLRLIDRAKEIAGDLLASMSEATLLHGDLHHYNILSATREPWLAIDPKGVIGERVYEVGAWLRNPLPQIARVSNLKKVLQTRVDIFVDRLGFDRARIIAWAFVQAVLAAWWCVEDCGEGLQSLLACAEAFADRL